MGSEQKEAVNAFAQKLLSEATVKTVGEDEAGTHLEVSVPARQGYAALRDAIAGLSPLPPEAPVPDPSAIPDKDIKVDAWVKDGTLTQMQIDFLQLSALGGHEVPAGVHSLALRMTFRDFAGTIEAPSVAVPVDIEQLAKMFAAQGMESSAMGSSSVGPATAIPDSVFPTMGCETLKTMSQEHIKSLLSGSPKEMKALARACPLLALQK
jgi:hypothetical protein